jgi:hypothetical protein
VPQDKSVVAALVLTFLFGPLGLLYVSVVGALILLAVGILLFFFTLGLVVFPVWIAAMIWAAVEATNQHSRYQAWLVDRTPPFSGLVAPGTPYAQA